MFWDTLRSDLRFAVRQAIASPLYTVLAVLALGLGIGASTTVFTLVNGVLLRPLPYQNPERLVMIWSDNREENRPRNVVSPANFLDYQTMSRTLAASDYMLSFLMELAVKGSEDRGRLAVLRTGPQLLQVLGRPPTLGRLYGPSDRGVAVISHRFWMSWFAGDRQVLGRTLTMSGNETVEIVGVMPEDFVFPYQSMFGPWASGTGRATDMWVPMPFEGPRWTDAGGQLVRSVHALAVIGRLRDGVSIEQARADLASVAERLEETHPATNRRWGTTVVPLMEQTVGDVRSAMLMLLGGVLLILLMATVNVANLVLARSVARRRERALRVALGAARSRLIQQALTEGLLLAALGGFAGILAANWGVQLLLAFAPSTLPRLDDVSPDRQALLFAIIASVLAGALIGLLPAWAATRGDVRSTLQDQSRGTTVAAGRRVRDGLLVVEVSLAVMLTVAGGLLLHSFVRVISVDPGFAADSLVTFQMNTPDRLTAPAARQVFYEGLFDRLEQLPGVTAVGGTTRIPLGSTSVTTSIQVEGQPDTGVLPEAEFRRAMRDYFQTMGIPVVRGRAFRPDDGLRDEPVAIVNQRLARRLFGESDPIGRRLRTGPATTGPWATVIGVIGDIRHTSLETEPLSEIYFNYASNPPNSPFLAIRGSSDAAALAGQLRSTIRSLDPTAGVFDIRTMSDIRSESIAARRFIMLAVVACTLLALTLAGVGVYGVVTLVVTERIPEMGVRLALGARPASVRRLVVSDAMRLAVAGVALGLLASAATIPLIRQQLFGVSSVDPLTLLAAPSVLLATALLAALVPAQRAMRIDPMQALRNE